MPNEPATTAAERVLLVDDDPGLRRLVRVLLERDGRMDVVAEASDGAEALLLVPALQPDIVLLDLRMPGVDPRAQLPQLVAQAPRCMIVVLSGLPALAAEDSSLAAGAFAYLQKSAVGPGLPQQLRVLRERFDRALTGSTVCLPPPPRVAS